MPKLGQNRIQEALDDYDSMVNELAMTKRSLNEYITLANKLQAENEALKQQHKMQADFLTRQHDMVSEHRDRLQTSLKGLMTRYRVIRECFAQCETEALAEGLNMNEITASKNDGAGESELRALAALGLDDPSRRTTTVAANKL